MTNAEIDDAVRDIQDWMNEAKHGALKAVEISRLMSQVKALAKAAKSKNT